jgi:hypothetical protein
MAINATVISISGLKMAGQTKTSPPPTIPVWNKHRKARSAGVTFC